MVNSIYRDRKVNNPQFPLRRSGYQSAPFAEVRDRASIEKVLIEVKKNTDAYLRMVANPHISASYSGEFVVGLSLQLERDLFLLTHQFHGCGSESDGSLPQDILGYSRAIRAFHALSRMRLPDYHSLANLYYALMRGQSTLGSGSHSHTLSEVLFGMQQKKISNPSVLVLGFSTVYSLENLLALLFLSGFKTARVVAMDIAVSPLHNARRHFDFTNSCFNYSVDYLQADARQLPFGNRSFDLVATHLLFTHIPNREKLRVFRETARVLKKGGIMVDEELVVPPEVDLLRYRDFYRTLGEDYPGTREEKIKASEYMFVFGSYGKFFPYQRLEDIQKDISRSGLQAAFPYQELRRFADRYSVIGYHIVAEKKK